MSAKMTRVVTPFLTALGLLAGTTCLEQGSEPADSSTLPFGKSAHEAALARETPADLGDTTGGAVCGTDDGAPTKPTRADEGGRAR